MTHARNALRALRLVLLAAALPSLLTAQQVLDTPPVLPPGEGLLPLPGLEVITTPDGFDNFDLGVDNAEPHMSTHPSQPLWFFNAFNTNRAHYTTDGHAWTYTAPVFGGGATMRGDPVTAYDSIGNLYYENMYSATSGGSIIGCKTMVSTNNGASWSASATSVDGVDKNWIACDQTRGPFANYAYTTMTASGGGNFSRSTNFGTTWTNTASFSTQSLPGMMPAVGPDVLGGRNIPGGCVYVVTNSGPTEASTYTFYRSTDGGLTFAERSALTVAGYVGTRNSVGRLVINNARTRPYPFIAADNGHGPFRGRLYLVYAANDPPGNGNKPDIFLQYSDDQAATWSSRVIVNDNPSPQSTNEWFPAIWCDKTTGRLYIKWYDMRNDPSNLRAWVYGTYTDDGGATFAPNQKISNADFAYPSPACSPNSNCYRGDYDAMASNPYVSLSVWTDFRNGNYGSVTGYFPDFAMLVSPASDTLEANDSIDVRVKVPAVKLYTHPAVFSASVSPAGGVAVSFPDGATLTSYPDSLRMRIRTSGAADGLYTVTVTGSGPNGTPVHKRSVSVRVQTVVRAVEITSPDGGNIWPTGSVETIRWTSSNLPGDVRILLSRNGGASYPETLFAATPNDGQQAWTVTGPPTGSARVRIAGVSYPAAADTGDGVFTIQELSLGVSPGWNMVSLPSAVGDRSVRSVFPSAAGPAYLFLPSGYISTDTLEPGMGYWLRFDSAGTVPLGGQATELDTIPVPEGWSLMGSIGWTVETDSIRQIPQGNLQVMYAFDPVTGYVPFPERILPGQAVWVNCTSVGSLILRRPAGTVPPAERTAGGSSPRGPGGEVR
ncbi:MAG: sialidase family protein [Bacteroidota bacterium]